MKLCEFWTKPKMEKQYCCSIKGALRHMKIRHIEKGVKIECVSFKRSVP